jgi:hypothetical protein
VRPACLEISWKWIAAVWAVAVGLVPWAIKSNHEISRARNRAHGFRALKRSRFPFSKESRPRPVFVPKHKETKPLPVEIKAYTISNQVGAP